MTKVIKTNNKTQQHEAGKTHVGTDLSPTFLCDSFPYVLSVILGLCCVSVVRPWHNFSQSRGFWWPPHSGYVPVNTLLSLRRTSPPANRPAPKQIQPHCTSAAWRFGALKFSLDTSQRYTKLLHLGSIKYHRIWSQFVNIYSTSVCICRRYSVNSVSRRLCTAKKRRKNKIHQYIEAPYDYIQFACNRPYWCHLTITPTSQWGNSKESVLSAVKAYLN